MKIIGLSVFITPQETLYTLCLLDADGSKYTADFKNGYSLVSRFPLMHYSVKPYDNIRDVFDLEKSFLNLDYFKLKPRFREIKRKVWIFKGDSLLGKTFLSDKMNLSKYETDSSATLPEIFKEEIIVLGNKYSFTLEEIVSKIQGDVEIILVDFNSYKGNL